MGLGPALGLGDAGLARRLAARRMDRGGREGGDASPGSPFPALFSTMRPDPQHKHAPRHTGAPLPPFGEKIKSNQIQYGSLAGTSGDGEQAAAPGLPARPAVSPMPAGPGGQQLRPPAPTPPPPGKGQHTPVRAHTHTQMAREEGESFQPLQPNNQHLQAPDRHGGQHTDVRPGPRSNGAARPESEGRGPGARREGGKSRETISGFFQWKYRRCRARLMQGREKGDIPATPATLPSEPVQMGKSLGLQIKSGGAGLGCTAEPGSARPPRGTRAPARAPRCVTFLLHLEQQLFFPFPSPPLPLLSSRFIPACSSSHSLPPSAILQACDVGSRSPLTHI